MIDPPRLANLLSAGQPYLNFFFIRKEIKVCKKWLHFRTTAHHQHEASSSKVIPCKETHFKKRGFHVEVNEKPQCLFSLTYGYFPW